MAVFRIGDRVRIISKQELRVRFIYEDDYESTGVEQDMIKHGGKITTITRADYDEDEYKVEVDGSCWRWHANRLTILPPKQPTLVKVGNCICGHKNTKLMNIQGDYICEDCIKVIFNSYVSKSKKLMALKFKKSKCSK